MPLYRVRVIGRWVGSGVQQDDMSMSWGVSAAAPPSVAALQAEFTALRTIPTLSSSWAGVIPSQWGTHAWEVRPAAGGQVINYGEVARQAGSVSGQPPQLTLPVSWVVPAGAMTARRGRLNFGPVGGTSLGTRPNTTIRGYVLNFCTAWHARLLSIGCTPVYLYNGGTASLPILGYSLGNSYGTLRSRTSEVTERQTNMV